MPPIIMLKPTKKFRNSVAVDHLSLEIKEGENLRLSGPNGVGKTTAIKSAESTAFIGPYDVAHEQNKVCTLIGVAF